MISIALSTYAHFVGLKKVNINLFQSVKIFQQHHLVDSLNDVYNSQPSCGVVFLEASQDANTHAVSRQDHHRSLTARSQKVPHGQHV